MGGGSSSEIISTAKYLPGVENLITKLSEFIPEYIAEPTAMAYQPTATAGEQSIYNMISNLAGQGWMLPADQQIASSLLGMMGLGTTGLGTTGITGLGTAGTTTTGLPATLDYLLGGFGVGTTGGVAEPTTQEISINLADEIRKQLEYEKAGATTPTTTYGITSASDPRLAADAATLARAIQEGQFASGGQMLTLSPSARVELYNLLGGPTGDLGEAEPAGLGSIVQGLKEQATRESTIAAGRTEAERTIESMLKGLEGLSITVPTGAGYGYGGYAGTAATAPTTTVATTEAPTPAITLPYYSAATPILPQTTMDALLYGTGGLTSLLGPYSDYYRALEQSAGADLQKQIADINQYMAARGRMGSGAQVGAGLEAAQSTAAQLAQAMSQLGGEAITQARGLQQYQAGQQQAISQALANAYGATGLAGIMQGAQTIGAMPRGLEEAGTQASIQDLMYRIGLGSRLAQGFGQPSVEVSERYEPYNWGETAISAAQPLALGLSAYLGT